MGRARARRRGDGRTARGRPHRGRRLNALDWEPLLRVLVAAGLSTPIGLERELRGKAAGLRTHVVVAVASAALGYLSQAAAAGTPANDATRIAAQVVTGVGFLGAGIIFASGGRVHGLTTAAAVWSAMAIGLCAGMGGYAIASALVAVTLLFLTPVDVITQHVIARFGHEERSFHIVVRDLPVLNQAQDALVAVDAQPREVELGELGERIAARILVRCRPRQVPDAYHALLDVEGVEFVSKEALQRGEG